MDRCRPPPPCLPSVRPSALADRARIFAGEMTTDDRQPTNLDESRQDVLGVISGGFEQYHRMDKSGLLPEQHARSMVELARVRDKAALEIAEHMAELAKTNACVDWGSVSTQDWIRHTCQQSSGAAADFLHIGEQLSNLPKTLDAVREGEIGFAHAAIIARHAQAITHSDRAEP